MYFYGTVACTNVCKSEVQAPLGARGSQGSRPACAGNRTGTVWVWAACPAVSGRRVQSLPKVPYFSSKCTPLIINIEACARRVRTLGMASDGCNPSGGSATGSPGSAGYVGGGWRGLRRACGQVVPGPLDGPAGSTGLGEWPGRAASGMLGGRAGSAGWLQQRLHKQQH